VRVTFKKTDHHRYGVHVQRDRAPDLWMYGPKYDDELPHDVIHFVGEAEFGLDDAIFGDVAAGGNAKSFMPLDRDLIPKLWRRKRIHKYVLPEGRRSEEIAYVLEQLSHERRHGVPRDPWVDELLGRLRLDPAIIERALAWLAELAPRWAQLPADGELTLEWPRPEGRKRHPPRDRYRKRSRQTRRPSRQ